MKTFRFIAMALLAMLMCVNFTSCKDNEDGPSSNSLIGVWEGIEADSWSIVPGSHDEDEEWWTGSPDKQTDNGVDISNYRIEFNSDMFYRTYHYNEGSSMWYLGGVGKWSVSGKKRTLVSYDSGDDKYDEENPDEYNILEHTSSRMTLEYYKNTPAGENYRKMTFRQIATKDEMFDVDNDNSGVSDDINVGKREYPSSYLGRWQVDGNTYEAFEIKSNGSGSYWNREGGEWIEYEDEVCRWFVSNGKLYFDDTDGEYYIYNVLSISDNKVKLEFTGYVYTDEEGVDDKYIDDKGEIVTLNRV